LSSDTPASLLATSSPMSLSFQSAFHLSLTVLVRYRSLVNMELQMDVPTSMELQSQTTRLVEQIRVRQVRRRSVTGFSPSPMSYSKELRPLQDTRLASTLKATFQSHRLVYVTGFKLELLPASLAVTKGILVSSFSSPY
jgi:hypothetical protein